MFLTHLVSIKLYIPRPSKGVKFQPPGSVFGDEGAKISDSCRIQVYICRLSYFLRPRPCGKVVNQGLNPSLEFEKPSLGQVLKDSLRCLSPFQRLLFFFGGFCRLQTPTIIIASILL